MARTMKALRKILRDDRGNATMDFAFLVPILLMLFIGVVEITNILRLDQKVVAATQTAADLVTQRRSVTHAELNDILTAVELIFEPFAAAPHSVGIVSVVFDEDGDPEVDWTKTKNSGSVPDALAVSAGLGQPGDGVVVVRVTYDYAPVFFDFLLNPMEIEEMAVLRPRRSSIVEGP